MKGLHTVTQCRRKMGGGEFGLSGRDVSTKSWKKGHGPGQSRGARLIFNPRYAISTKHRSGLSFEVGAPES